MRSACAGRITGAGARTTERLRLSLTGKEPSRGQIQEDRKLKPDDGGQAAAEILRAQITDLREHAGAAVTCDVEGVHDLRVSVKRMRETLSLFRRLLPTKRRETMLPAVDLLNDTLGQVRERDVLIMDAEELAGAVGDDGGLTAVAIERRQAERDLAFEHLLRVWSRMCSEGLFEALDEIRRRTAKRGRSANQIDVERFAYRTARSALQRVHERLERAGPR